MPDDLAVRGAALAVLLLALCGLFVLGGTGWPMAPDPPPSAGDLDGNYERHVGDTIETAGTVVETDPVVVEVQYDSGVFGETEYRLQLAGAPPTAVGDNVYFSGEVRPDRTVAVDTERALVRAPDEITYMYAVSALAALVILARFVNGWRLRLRQLAFTPRERTLYRRWRGETDA